ncbi:hypothetical protein ABK040_003057 [Willaertia magna]
MNRYPIIELFSVFVNFSKHRSLTKSEEIGQRWSTIGTICGCIGSWIGLGYLYSQQKSIEINLQDVKTKRENLLKSKYGITSSSSIITSSSSLLSSSSNMNKEMNIIKETENEIKRTVENESSIIQSIKDASVPVLTAATVFLGFYFFGRVQSYRKYLLELTKAEMNNLLVDKKVSTYKPLSRIKIK